MKRVYISFDRVYYSAFWRVKNYLWAFMLLIMSCFSVAMAEEPAKMYFRGNIFPLKNIQQDLPMVGSSVQNNYLAQVEFYNGQMIGPLQEPTGLPFIEKGRALVKNFKWGEKDRVEVDLIPQVDKTLAVTAVINRQHLATFVIDTGASYTVITPDMARAWGISLPLSQKQTVVVTTANGNVEAPLVTLKNVNLGGMDMADVEAVVIDLGHTVPASGLLGMNFFEGMEFIVRPNKLILSRFEG